MLQDIGNKSQHLDRNSLWIKFFLIESYDKDVKISMFRKVMKGKHSLITKQKQVGMNHKLPYIKLLGTLE